MSSWQVPLLAVNLYELNSGGSFVWTRRQESTLRVRVSIHATRYLLINGLRSINPLHVKGMKIVIHRHQQSPKCLRSWTRSSIRTLLA